MTDWSDYESGPFCPHWIDLSVPCREFCTKCGHSCGAHSRARDACTERDCDCTVLETED